MREPPVRRASSLARRIGATQLVVDPGRFYADAFVQDDFVLACDMGGNPAAPLLAQFSADDPG